MLKGNNSRCCTFAVYVLVLLPLQSPQGFTPLLCKADGSSQQMLNCLWNHSWIYFLVGFGFLLWGTGNNFACSCAGGWFFLKTYSLVLSVLLQTGVSRSSAITCFKVGCVRSQRASLRSHDEFWSLILKCICFSHGALKAPTWLLGHNCSSLFKCSLWLHWWKNCKCKIRTSQSFGRQCNGNSV